MVRAKALPPKLKDTGHGRREEANHRSATVGGARRKGKASQVLAVEPLPVRQRAEVQALLRVGGRQGLSVQEAIARPLRREGCSGVVL